MSNRKLYATLIGINAYEKARSLNGCIKDILNADRFLRHLCSQQQGSLDYNPLYLLAPHTSDKLEIEQYKTTEKVAFDPVNPTFENVTGRAFDHLAQASGNDICLLYYSGHGSFINAAPEFWHSKATHQSETLVCVDSRSGSRDLIDKELAYLLHKTLQDKPDVHCLVIMDCCHSGNNSREVDQSLVSPQYRQESPSNQQVSIENYLGYKEKFFTIQDGNANFPIANYVHLAACRDHEKALDGYAGGVFSRRLMELLNKGGRNASYRSIVQSLAATVSIQNGSQNPVAFSATDGNLNKQFLGGQIIPYTPSYEVRYIESAKYWQLQAGSMQGIVPSAGENKTLLHIAPANIVAEVTSVDDFTATLTGEALTKLDITRNDYTATIKKLAIKRQVIGFSQKLQKKPDGVQALINQFNANSYVYFELNHEAKDNNDFLIDVLERQGKSWYYLSQTKNDIPLFKAETDSKTFLENVDAVGKWIYVKGLESGPSMYNPSDFIFTAKVIEGTKIKESNINNLPGKVSTLSPGSRIELAYKDDLLPALEFSVEIHPDSNIQECFIQALYLDGLYGIKTDFSEPDSNRLTKGGKFELKTNINGKYYNLVRLELDKELAGYNINEIIEQLKIIVSSKANIQLNAYAQKSLEAEPAGERGATKSVANNFFDSNDEANWAVFNFKVRIIGPEKGKTLTPGAETVFSSFSIQAPAGFNAVATAVTNADLPPQTRSLEKSTSPAVWGNILAEQAPFGDGVASMIDSSVIALELSAVNGQPMPVLPAGEELIIQVKQNGATRSVDGYESTIVPYGYDEATQLYFPIGYEDLSGNIRINQLPSPSGDTLLGEAITTRSLIGSIKLYFKKILRLPVNTLALHLYKNDQWEMITDLGKIKQHIQALPQHQKLPLIVHGIFGDTKGMLEGLKVDKDLTIQFPAVLSFDFENMSTEVPDTAKILKQALEQVGIGQEGKHKLIVIAHSMGGLVSRWLIEKEKGAHLVEKLIMAGTPNGGSEWSQASGHILNGARFLLTHALNVAGPVKYAITGISFFLKKFHDPQTALKGMDMESEVIKELKKQVAAAPPIPYFLVGSDTSLFRDYNDEDKFLLKVKNLFMKKIV
ncbi:MAG TPA: caspase family protein, partial [Niastella sp.]